MRAHCLLSPALLLALAAPASLRAQKVVQYDFNGDLTASTANAPDLLPGAAPPAGAPGVTFEAADIGGQSAGVARITAGTFFLLQPDAPANGGGAYLNDYTLIADMQVPGRGGDCTGSWVSLYNTELDNGNDGDCFVHPSSGGVGISGDYDIAVGASCIDAGWHRIALVVSTGGNVFRTYVDGAFANEVNVGGLDGRWALYSSDNPDGSGRNGLNLFGDNDGDVAELLVGSARFVAAALSDADIAALGGPTALGIGVEPPLANDECGIATALAVPSFTTGSTAEADPDNTGLCDSNDSPSVWFKVTGTGEELTVSLCGSSYDTVLAIYEGTCDALSCLASNDDDCRTRSRIVFPSAAGTEYFIQVFGFGSESGDFALTVGTPALHAPPNDLCAGAELIDLSASNPATVSGNTDLANPDPENDTCGDSAAGGVWYTVAGTGGAMTASLCNTANYDTRLSVFSGSCGALACVGENDDADGCDLTSHLEWSSLFGTTYYILVHGYSNRTGQFQLTVSGEPQPCMQVTSCRPDQRNKTVSLAWETIAAGHTGIDIRLGGELVHTAGPADTSYTHTPDLPEGTPYAVLDYEISAAGVAFECSATCRAILSTGKVCLADDFDDYADDTDLEVNGGWFRIDENSPVEDATWTITNPGGRSNPPTLDGRPSTGKFIVSDSDAAGGANPTGSGMSHDIWSPPFSTVGKAEVWLHMDVSAQLNNNGKCVFDIDLSTDGGATWQNVFRRVAPSRVEAAPLADTSNSDGFFGRLDADLSAAAGLSEVRFRLRHFEPNDDWWIAVDNVVVDDQPPLGGGAVSLLPSEGFSGGIPAGWTVRSLAAPPNTGTETWHTTDKGGRTIGAFPHQDGRGAHRLTPSAPFAILDSDADPDPAEDEYLITPALDLSAFGAVFLHYDSETVVSGAVQEVLVSLDGGATFLAQPIFSYRTGALVDTGEDPFYASRVFKVAEAAGQGDVAFAFHWVGQDDWWWAVDNVQVTANLAPEANVNLQLAGDCTQDGQRTIADVICTIIVAFPGFVLVGQGPTAACADDAGNLAVLDVNGDGAFNLSDIVYLARYVFSGGPPPARGTGCFVLDAALGCPDDPLCQ